ncbi:unnamed protein product [Soboliphyme baturini]|uniref:DJ-1_PfpI domain-containing protein n=1 Tax=Soboliphyme baturini TaxID=241478 RepID=A0A183J2R6_9BILA|nr:unnamed protein product [Soboliphyme baturini]
MEEVELVQNGSKLMASSAKVGQILQEQESAGRLIAAICAAPIALKSHGIAKNNKVTSHPCVKKEMEDGGYHYSEERVVHDGSVVTSRGPGTAHEFGVKLVEILKGKDKAEEVKKPMILNF